MARKTTAQIAAQAAIEAMKREGMSQAAIAAELGTSQPTVSRWGRGKATPNSHAMSSLAPYVPGDLLDELAAEPPKTLPERVAAIESQLAEVQAALAKLQGG